MGRVYHDPPRIGAAFVGSRSRTWVGGAPLRGGRTPVPRRGNLGHVWARAPVPQTDAKAA